MMICYDCESLEGTESTIQPDPVDSDGRCERCGHPLEDGCANDSRTGFLARLKRFGLGEAPRPLFSSDWRRPIT
jgi:hypothetical protein